MTALDIILLVLMGGGAILGFLRGFVQEILSLGTWILVVLAVRFLHLPVTDFLREPVGSDSGASMLAFASLVILTYALGKALARAVGKRTRKSILGPVDRVLGFGFGLIKGLILATLAYLLFVLLYDTVFGAEAERPEWLAQSRTFPLLNASGNAIIDLVEQQTTEETPAEPAS